VEAGLDGQQPLVEGDELVPETSPQAEEHVLVLGNLKLDLAANAPAEDLAPTDDLLPAVAR
jgi:hypothetical protein